MNLDQLEKWLNLPSENEHLEFKEAKNNFHTEKLIKYCAAIANEGGGNIVLGVSDKLPRKVVGTTTFQPPERISADISQQLNLKIKPLELEHPDGRVLVFSIPSRPQGQPIMYKGCYYMRAGESLTPMTPDYLKSIFSEGQLKFEKRIAENNLSPEDIVRLLDTQSYFDLIQIPYPAERNGVIARFLSENLIIQTGESYAITNLGALLFAKNLDDFETLSRKGIRVTVYNGTDKLEMKRDIIGKRGYAFGFQNLIEYVNSQLPSNEIIEKALRNAVPMYPEIAIRELIANSFIHQDLEQSGNYISIDIYDNRLEISNPGLPCIETDRFIDEYQSRNEQLADLMRRLRICEEKGSGFDKVINAVETFQLPPPEIRLGQVRTTVVLFAHKDLSTMDKGDKLRACYQHCVLRYLIGEKMTNQSLRERFGLSDRQSDVASRLVGVALEDGLIKLEDPSSTSRRYAQYIPYWA